MRSQRLLLSSTVTMLRFTCIALAVLVACNAAGSANHDIVDMFDRIDGYHGNKDGNIDMDELMVWHGHKHTKENMGPEDTWRVTFKMMDENGDGMLSRKEFHCESYMFRQVTMIY
jgi:Ca2+-binding EF-hand superfamily protein